jgi:TRAP-type C4-dicarboxylate transport system permease small subunit
MLRFAERLKNAQLRLAMLALFVMMMVIVIDVAMRYLFSRPIHGAYDVVEASLVIFVFHSLSACFLARQNIVIDLIDNIVSEHITHALVRLSDLITIGVLALMVWAMVTPARQAFEYGDRKLELGLPLSILWAIAIAGVACTLFCALGALVKPVVTSHGRERT